MTYTAIERTISQVKGGLRECKMKISRYLNLLLQTHFAVKTCTNAEIKEFISVKWHFLHFCMYSLCEVWLFTINEGLCLEEKGSLIKDVIIQGRGF